MKYNNYFLRNNNYFENIIRNNKKSQIYKIFYIIDFFNYLFFI